VSDSTAKVRSRVEAADWRGRQHGKVVFTNGVFDLLHPGHVELLVGVNTDASVRRLGKGSDRPIVPEGARTRVLAGLAAVDCVVLFDEDTPLDLITALTPDVLVKGADYTVERIVGADVVQARGGRVVRIPIVAGFSTTSIIERLRASS